MKALRLTILILCMALQSFATARSWLGGTGVFTVTTNWSPNGTPTSSDALTVSGSTNMSLTGACAAASIDFTGYTGSVACTSGSLTVSGSVTFVSGMAFTASTTTFTINGTGTLTSAISIPMATAVSGTITVTLGSDITMAKGITTSGNVTFSGAHNISCTTFTLSGITSTITLSGNITASGLVTVGGAAGSTMVVNGAFTINGSAGLTHIGSNTVSGTTSFSITGGTITYSSTGTLQCNLTYSNVTFATSNPIKYSTGVLVDAGGTNVTTGSTLQIAGSCTLSTGTTSWNNVTISATASIVNNAALTILGTLSLTGASSTVTFGGSFGFNDSTFSCAVSGVTLNLAHAFTYNIYSSFTAHATLASPMSISSDDGTLTVALNYYGMPSNQSVWFVNPTRVNSAAGNALYSLNATITGSTNWYQLLARGNSPIN